MAKVREVNHTPGDGCADLLFWCPGCKCCHGVWVTGKNSVGATWTWNGNMDRPTFSPSLKIERQMWMPPVTPENLEQWKQNPWEQTKQTHICHTFVRNGVIEFLSDCTHALAGKSIPMEEF